MTQTAIAPTGQSLITTMANRYGLEPGKFYSTLEKTILPSNKQATQEQVAAFLVVANHYQLNPFVKEIFAFPSQSGGIQPIVSVDGWLTLINRQPNLDGIKYEDHFDSDGKLTAITCRIFRKDRTHPNEITEYMSECRRNTPTWSQWPARMLRHKALIQCARQAFGLAGIYDPDEAERIAESEGNGNGGGHIADRTRERVDEMKARYTPAESASETEPDVIDAEPVISDIPTEPPADTDADAEASQAEADAVETDPLDSLRADAMAMFDELPKSRQKDLIAGKATIAGRPKFNSMTEEEIHKWVEDMSVE